MRSKPALAAAAVAIVAAASSVASATPGFPAGIKADLSLAYTPPCTVCHVGASANGTANQPFATSLKAQGLTPGDDASLSAALGKITAQDSDSNGTPDIEQLKAGCDPNSDITIQTGATCGGTGSGGAADTAPTPAYGCGNTGAQIAAGPVGSSAVLAGLLAVLGLALARRRSH